jgi:hypothetical protein
MLQSLFYSVRAISSKNQQCPVTNYVIIYHIGKYAPLSKFLFKPFLISKKFWTSFSVKRLYAKQDQGSKAPSTSALNQLNNELLNVYSIFDLHP